jgi:hypothetical protein
LEETGFIDELPAPTGAAGEPTATVETAIDATARETLKVDTLAEPAEVEQLMAEEAPWLESDVAPGAEAAIGAGSLSEPVEDELTPPAAPEVAIEGEMIVATDETLAPLAEEILHAEEAPWYEDSNIFTADDAGRVVAAEAIGAAGAEDAALVMGLVAAPEEILDGDQQGPALAAREPEAQTVVDALETLADKPGKEELEAALLALDSLALPAGKTLADVETTMGETRGGPARDLTAALAWLESALTGSIPARPKHSTLLDMGAEELIAQMPDDPDAVLAWLEEMAGEESLTPTEPIAPGEERRETEALAAPPARLGDEFFEADLLAMPEDPDEAMIWLEGLARRGEPATSPTAAAAPSATIQEEVADDLFSDPIVKKPWEEEPQERVVQEEKPAAPEAPSPPTPAENDVRDAWVDLLRPLD